uniref:Uncharacterized protein n=1 Tax=Arundo donax TaxID=35708 RepID=A0A0A8Y7F0_ARUDO
MQLLPLPNPRSAPESGHWEEPKGRQIESLEHARPPPASSLPSSSTSPPRPCPTLLAFAPAGVRPSIHLHQIRPACRLHRR